MITEALSLAPILAKLLDRLIPDPQAREQAKLALMQAENQQLLEELRLQLSVILVEAQSPDPWTSRARPTFLYLIYSIIATEVVGSIIGIWFPEQVFQAAKNLKDLLSAIPSDLWWLFGAGYLGYTGARSFEKTRGVAK
jgi:hypothetical protein